MSIVARVEFPPVDERSAQAELARIRGRRFQLAMIAVFVGVLVIPAFDLAFHLDPNPSPLRDTVELPDLRFDRSLREVPGKLLWYVKSSMGFRASLVRAHGLFKQRILGVSPAPGSVLVASPWLFMTSEHVVEDYRRVSPFTREELTRWSRVLEERRAWLAARGIRYLVVVAPNKETVYAEALPAWVTRAPTPSRRSQLVEHLAATTSVEVLDLTSALLAAKREGRVYHHTDTHWNDLGAFAGYRAIVDRMRRAFPSLHPLEAASLDRTEVTTRGGDLARTCGLAMDLRETQLRLDVPERLGGARLADGAPFTFSRMDVRGVPRFETRAPDGEVPSAIVLRDSFADLLLPYLSRHFARATWIWTYDFPADEIAARRPAIVVEQLVERKLMTIEPSNPERVSLGR